jgi:hypothetical protein
MRLKPATRAALLSRTFLTAVFGLEEETVVDRRSFKSASRNILPKARA